MVSDVSETASFGASASLIANKWMFRCERYSSQRNTVEFMELIIVGFVVDDTIFDVVGCLEYDPNLPAPKRHRQYLKSCSRLVLSFHN